MDRRQMLNNAVLGGAAGIVGATALGSVGPEAAFAASEVSEEECAEMAEGIVTSINGAQVTVERGDGVMQRVMVTNGTSIWKLHPSVSFDAIEVGDFFDARGVPVGGALAADAVWVNIVSYMAHIVSISHNRMVLEHNGHKVTGHVVPGTTVASYNSTPGISDLSPLRVGDHIQVIGAQRPGSGQLEIATIYARV